MKYMTAEQIRETWLEFFRSKGHRIEESVSLIPQSDPTLLWINAGVAPLKKYFDGSETPPNPRLANVQKCIRTNDIDHVGKTARHHTFFEMLGNFSIGDYFKHDAIRYAFELLTEEKWFGFPLEKLYFTYYPDDLEACDEWISCGVDPAHVIPRSDNFWEIGPGPCGPDTEVYFDRGPAYDPRGKELIEEDIENERYIEIWNIVFSQFNSKADLARPDYPELPSKNIDTGAGLERFACVLQDAETNFETDLFYPIIERIEAISGKTYDHGMAFKVIADHIKALVFAISDGAILSNEGRGYVLRRLLRRAVKYGLKLGLDEPFLHDLVDEVVRVMGVFYRNLYRTKDIVKRIVFKEEEKFFETIREGERHLLEVIEKEGDTISGSSAFKLYDTYGFPIELTVEYAEEQGVRVDREGFYTELEKQKERSRRARKVESDMKSQKQAYMSFKEPSRFIGYDKLATETSVIKVFPEGIVLKETPFYATSGGQVADQGTINGVEVKDVSKLPNGQFLHRVDATFEAGEEVLAIVDAEKRAETIKNHSAAHLFHQAIKDVLGTHAHQQGSQVAPKAWRFDFNHFETLDDRTVLAIEKRVKHFIKEEPLNVEIRNMPLEEAKAYGAQALFGEKYGDIVRVVDMGWSKELCGGTHVSNTREIIDFAITSYESIGSGIYRMEGVTGPNVREQMKAYLAPFQKEVDALVEKALRGRKKTDIPMPPEVKGSYQDIIDFRGYIVRLKEIVKEQEKALLREKQRDVLKDIDRLIEDRRSRRQVIVTREIDPKVLKQVVDAIYDRIDAEVLFLANVRDDRATFICKSSLGNAAELIKKAAELTNGSGGGRGHFAQGGTQDLSDFADAMQEINEYL